MTTPLLIFVHTPRTAGTSLWQALVHTLPPVRARGRIWPQVLICAHGHRMQEPESPQGYGLTEGWLDDYITQVQANPYIRCVGGHLPYGLHTAFPDEPCQYLTLLRDPVARVLSLYSMMRARPVVYNDAGQAIGEPLAHYWSEHYELDLLAMLDAQEFRLCNDQTRMITGGSTDPEAAMAVLEERYSFGVLEHLDLFAEECTDLLGAPLVLGHANQLGAKQRRHKPAVDRYIPTPQEREALRDANAADIAVYEWARQKVLSHA